MTLSCLKYYTSTSYSFKNCFFQLLGCCPWLSLVFLALPALISLFPLPSLAPQSSSWGHSPWTFLCPLFLSSWSQPVSGFHMPSAGLPLCLFLVAAWTNHCKVGDFEQHRSVRLQVWKSVSPSQNWVIGRTSFFQGASLLLASSSSGDCYIPCLWPYR